MSPRKSTRPPRELHPDEISYRPDITAVSRAVETRLDRCCGWLLAEEVRPRLKHKPNGETLGKYKAQLAFAVMNLYRAWSISPDQKVSIPTSNEAYGRGEVLGKKGFTAEVAENIMDGLELGGYLVGYGSRAYVPKKAQGDVFNDGNKPTFKSTGNLWTATPKLIGVLDFGYGLLPEMFKYGKAAERVCHVRDQDKRHIPQGEYTTDRRAHDRGLRCVNELLCSTPVLLDLKALETAPAEVAQEVEALRREPWKLDRTLSTLYRTYTSDTHHGGRYYGHRVQTWPKVLRNGYLLIGEHRAVGLDFKSFNIAAAYADEGLAIPKDFDPYAWPECPLPRKVMKKLMVAALNGGSRIRVAQAIRDEVDGGWSVSELADALGSGIGRLPQQVQGKFCSPDGYGLKAMWKESEIAFRVMVRMADSGYPVVPIHDGFLCQEPHRDALEANMVQASEEVLGRALVVTEG